MSRESRLWLAAAGGVAIIVVAVVLLFGVISLPDFPSLYDEGAPTVGGSVAYLDYDRDDCVRILDVATGDSREVFCDDWMWLEGWDADGNLRIHAGNGAESVWVVDPNNGDVIGFGDWADGPMPEDTDSLRARSAEGTATLTYGRGDAVVTLIDIDAPRNYGFWSYGLTGDGQWAWVCDSADRLLLVALDGTSGPWLVADGISDPAWKEG